MKARIIKLNLDRILTAGGDGTFGEMINGLLQKTKKDANLDLNDIDIGPPKPKTFVGVLPCGL